MLEHPMLFTWQSGQPGQKQIRRVACASHIAPDPSCGVPGCCTPGSSAGAVSLYLEASVAPDVLSIAGGSQSASGGSLEVAYGKTPGRFWVRPNT